MICSSPYPRCFMRAFLHMVLLQFLIVVLSCYFVCVCVLVLRFPMLFQVCCTTCCLRFALFSFAFWARSLVLNSYSSMSSLCCWLHSFVCRASSLYSCFVLSPLIVCCIFTLASHTSHFLFLLSWCLHMSPPPSSVSLYGEWFVEVCSILCCHICMFVW